MHTTLIMHFTYCKTLRIPVCSVVLPRYPVHTIFIALSYGIMRFPYQLANFSFWHYMRIHQHVFSQHSLGLSRRPRIRTAFSVRVVTYWNRLTISSLRNRNRSGQSFPPTSLYAASYYLTFIPIIVLHPIPPINAKF